MLDCRFALKKISRNLLRYEHVNSTTLRRNYIVTNKIASSEKPTIMPAQIVKLNSKKSLNRTKRNDFNRK